METTALIVTGILGTSGLAYIIFQIRALRRKEGKTWAQIRSLVVVGALITICGWTAIFSVLERERRIDQKLESVKREATVIYLDLQKSREEAQLAKQEMKNKIKLLLNVTSQGLEAIKRAGEATELAKKPGLQKEDQQQAIEEVERCIREAGLYLALEQARFSKGREGCF